MTPLRQQMMDAMQVRGLAQRTQQTYVVGLANHATRCHRTTFW
ncbi:hypothetical protein [Ideonella dechloratans]